MSSPKDAPFDEIKTVPKASKDGSDVSMPTKREDHIEVLLLNSSNNSECSQNVFFFENRCEVLSLPSSKGNSQMSKNTPKPQGDKKNKTKTSKKRSDLPPLNVPNKKPVPQRQDGLDATKKGCDKNYDTSPSVSPLTYRKNIDGDNDIKNSRQCFACFNYDVESDRRENNFSDTSTYETLNSEEAGDTTSWSNNRSIEKKGLLTGSSPESYTRKSIQNNLQNNNLDDNGLPIVKVPVNKNNYVSILTDEEGGTDLYETTFSSRIRTDTSSELSLPSVMGGDGSLKYETKNYDGIQFKAANSTGHPRFSSKRNDSDLCYSSSQGNNHDNTSWDYSSESHSYSLSSHHSSSSSSSSSSIYTPLKSKDTDDIREITFTSDATSYSLDKLSALSETSMSCSTGTGDFFSLDDTSQKIAQKYQFARSRSYFSSNAAIAEEVGRTDCEQIDEDCDHDDNGDHRGILGNGLYNKHLTNTSSPQELINSDNKKNMPLGEKNELNHGNTTGKNNIIDIDSDSDACSKPYENDSLLSPEDADIIISDQSKPKINSSNINTENNLDKMLVLPKDIDTKSTETLEAKSEISASLPSSSKGGHEVLLSSHLLLQTADEISEISRTFSESRDTVTMSMNKILTDDSSIPDYTSSQMSPMDMMLYVPNHDKRKCKKKVWLIAASFVLFAAGMCVSTYYGLSESKSVDVAASIGYDENISNEPSDHPSFSIQPNMAPSNSIYLSNGPSSSKSKWPSAYPSFSVEPSAVHTISYNPSIKPTFSTKPSNVPSLSEKPSNNPSTVPTFSHNPSMKPTFSKKPSNGPSLSYNPSNSPSTSLKPSTKPSISIKPSTNPSVSRHPSTKPSISRKPSTNPSVSRHPSTKPSISIKPSTNPSTNPSVSRHPSTKPSISINPTTIPSISIQPIVKPSISKHASAKPSNTSDKPSISQSPSSQSPTSKLPSSYPHFHQELVINSQSSHPSPSPLPNSTAFSTPNNTNVSFYILRDTPHTPFQANMLVSNLQYLSPNVHNAKFVVHLGGIISPSLSLCDSMSYADAQFLFLKYRPAIPIFLALTENDWSFCPDPQEAYRNWMERFGHFEEYWNDRSFLVIRQTGREDNFAFVIDNVLFIGVTLTTNTVVTDKDSDGDDEAVNLNELSFNWTKVTLRRQRQRQDIKAVVIMSHSRSNQYTKRLKKLVEKKYSRMPIMYIHSDAQQYNVENVTGQLIDVQIDNGGDGIMLRPPMLVTVEKKNVGVDEEGVGAKFLIDGSSI